MSDAPADPDAPRVLVADDDDAVLKVYTRALTRAGFAVESARDGAGALARAREQTFDAVVSDIDMPGLDGIALLRALRALDLDLPVILSTGAPSMDSAIAAIDLGATKYVTKPVEPAGLVAAVKHAVELRRLAVIRRRILEATGDGEHQIADLAGLEVHFDRALVRITMAFQPIVRWSKRSVAGYEALVRSSEKALPHPGALFDAAERLRRLPDLGRAIRAACGSEAPRLPDDAMLFVNLHTQDLMDETLFDPDGPLAPHSYRVVLEITERARLEVVRDVAARVKRLTDLGFRVAIDDIGAGYAGLTSFALLEPHVVKLDMALVRGIDSAAMKQRLVRSLVEVCRSMMILVVAEGVETEAERDTLVELGCDLFQGYLFARPGPPFPQPVF